jgi:hypothetical protein
MAKALLSLSDNNKAQAHTNLDNMVILNTTLAIDEFEFSGIEDQGVEMRTRRRCQAGTAVLLAVLKLSWPRACAARSGSGIQAEIPWFPLREYLTVNGEAYDDHARNRSEVREVGGTARKRGRRGVSARGSAALLTRAIAVVANVPKKSSARAETFHNADARQTMHKNGCGVRKNGGSASSQRRRLMLFTGKPRERRLPQANRIALTSPSRRNNSLGDDFEHQFRLAGVVKLFEGSLVSRSHRHNRLRFEPPTLHE